MKRTLTYLTILIAAAPAAAQTSGAPPVDGIRTVQLKVRPAPAPRPALRYQFLPGVLDQTPGNAAQYYYLAVQLVPKEWPPEIDKVTTIPLAEVAQAAESPKMKSVLSGGAIRHVRLAARREYCHWDLPIRTEHFHVLLPKLSAYRSLARLLAFQARLQTARKEYDEAADTLQTGFALARHIAEGPMLIQDLVGAAIGSLMLAPVEDMIQQPDGPNLYWALAGLPGPFIDLRESMRWESSMIYLMLPELRDLGRAQLTKQQWQALTDDLARRVASLMGRDPDPKRAWQPRLAMTAGAVYLYPRAKQYLIAKGWTSEDVQAMPVQQAIAIYALETYVHVKDEVFKWFHVPYWQAREGMQQARLTLEEARRQHPANLLLAMLPTLSRAYFLTTKLDRKIAALRCIEAVRMYAAEHEGKLPARLGDITAVPIPMDPVTGKAFDYKVVGNTITVEAPAPKGELAREGIRYEVTFLKK